MLDAKKLEELLAKQEALAKEISLETEKLKSDSTMVELEHLRAECSQLKEQCEKMASVCSSLHEKNASLKHSLHEHLSKEKRWAVTSNETKMNLFFGESEKKGCHKLEQLEHNYKKRIATCSVELDSHIHSIKEKFYPRISALENEIAFEIDALKKEYRDYEKGVQREYSQHLQVLANTELPENAIEQVLKPPENKIEMVLGLRILASIGAIFIVLAVIFTSVFLHEQIPDWANTLILFSAAIMFLALGIFINRVKEKRTIFTHTILSIGVGLQYTALAVSYFAFGAINMWVALGICVAITAISYGIAVKLKSEIVAVFAQIGGYLPIITLVEAFFADTPDLGILYGAMVYFIILSVLGFLLSSRYKWQVLNYLGFGLNIVATIFVASAVVVISTYEEFTLLKGITLAFMFISFGLHTILPVFTNIKLRSRFTSTDFILIMLVTAINLILFYIMFAFYGLSNYTGYLSLFFVAFYIGLYLLVRKFFILENSIRTLFWMTALVFLILFMPMQFSVSWISFGWVLQGVVLVIYGLLKGKDIVLKTGLGISIIAIVGFIVMDVIIGNVLQTNVLESGINIFVYKYLFITLASLAVVGVLIYKRKLILGYFGQDRRHYIQGAGANYPQIYTGLAFINATGFLVYSVFQIFHATALEQISYNSSMRFIMFMFMLSMLFFMGVVAPKLFKAKSVYNVGIGISIVSLVFMLVIFSFRLSVFDGGEVGARVGMGFATAGTALVSLYIFYDLFIRLSELSDGTGKKLVIIASSCYFLFWYTFLLMHQYGVAFSSISITVAYIVVAFVCIGLGLYMRSAYTRRFALVVAMLAILKLFIIDIWALDIDMIFQIISFVAFGIMFLGMGFLYQIFYKRFAKLDEEKDKKNNNK